MSVGPFCLQKISTTGASVQATRTTMGASGPVENVALVGERDDETAAESAALRSPSPRRKCSGRACRALRATVRLGGRGRPGPVSVVCSIFGATSEHAKRTPSLFTRARLVAPSRREERLPSAKPSKGRSIIAAGLVATESALGGAASLAMVESKAPRIFDALSSILVYSSAWGGVEVLL